VTRDVLIRVSGVQMMDGDEDNVEIITTGDYFLRDGKRYIIYNEMMEETGENIRNTLKITEDKVEILKRGAINAHMVFEKNRKNMTRYVTPVGEMAVGVATTRISLDEQENSLKVLVDYSLDINYNHVSDCTIMVDVSSREGARLKLQNGIGEV